jgi:hypothetical protein
MLCWRAVGSRVSYTIREALVRTAPHYTKQNALTALRSLASIRTAVDMNVAVAPCVAALERHIAHLSASEAAAALLAYATLCAGRSDAPSIDVHHLFQRAARVLEPGNKVSSTFAWQVCPASLLSKFLWMDISGTVHHAHLGVAAGYMCPTVPRCADS